MRSAVVCERLVGFEEFAERPDADLRADVVPAYYRQVAGFHCAYQEG